MEENPKKIEPYTLGNSAAEQSFKEAAECGLFKAIPFL